MFPFSEDDEPLQIDVTSTLGRGPFCDDRGLCNLEVVGGGMSMAGANEIPSRVTKDKNGRFVISFFDSDLSPNMLNQYFRDNEFWVGENFQVPLLITKQLGFGDEQYYIPLGNYTVYQLNGERSIKFNLIEN